jgi:hypothetical protein
MKTAVDEDLVTAREPYPVRAAAGFVSPIVKPTPQERRQFARRRDRDLEWIKKVRLRSAGEVSLVDLSAGGALIDADVPLRPGALLSLEIVGVGLETVITLKVLRCHVTELMSDRARYRGACEFTRPLELPDLDPVPARAAEAPDSFVTVDATLKRLVERAYAADMSQRLAAGDVMLVLQSLSRRALEVDDPSGRHVGALLQKLLPALRQGHGLPAMLAVIEHQLHDELPAARLRLVDGHTRPAEGTKSVLINLPGAFSSSPSVSIDLPATSPVNESQARLLRTSTRLIALVQRLNGCVAAADTAGPKAGAASGAPLAAATLGTSEPDAAGGSSAWQKVVVRYTDGQMLKGFTQDFHGSKSQFSLWPSIDAAARDRVVVPLAQLKAVFFVRDFSGNPQHIEQKAFENAAHGRRIEVTLIDNEVLVGTTLNYRSDSSGFFIIPVDPLANNQRVYVVATAVRQVRFP